MQRKGVGRRGILFCKCVFGALGENGVCGSSAGSNNEVCRQNQKETFQRIQYFVYRPSFFLYSPSGFSFQNNTWTNVGFVMHGQRILSFFLRFISIHYFLSEPTTNILDVGGSEFIHDQCSPVKAYWNCTLAIGSRWISRAMHARRP